MRQRRRVWLHLILLYACATVALPHPAVAQTADRLSRWAGALDSLLAQPGELRPLPRCDSPYWRDSLPTELRRSYIAQGERELGQAWTVLPLTAFAEYKESGRRTGYEQLCFERRRRLAVLVMAELTEGEGRFMADVVNGLETMTEEPWWGIPAHYAKKMPTREEQTVDLFNAETAALVAWTAYVLQPRLDSFSTDLKKRLDAEVSRRLLEPARKGRYWWKTAGMNWNPWICSNWLACALLCETDRERQLDAVRQILRATDAFINAYPDDGGCDEGAAYWDRAAASMYEVLHLLRLATGGAIDLSRDDKVRAMGSYVYKTYIQSDLAATFADTHSTHASVQPSTLFPFGRFLGDKTMTALARLAADRSQWDSRAGELFSQSHNFPSLWRELHLLASLADFAREKGAEPRLRDVWLPDLQIMAARRADTYLAVKGGHNGESHNHNDVGSFIVYHTPGSGAQASPVLIDPAVGEYTAQTFSRDRYKIWTMQSAYHNLPQINGTDQRDGREHKATLLSHRPGRIALELAAAWGEEAQAESWQRTVSISQGGSVSVEERYRLKQATGPTSIMLITPLRPTADGRGTIRLGDYRLRYSESQLTAITEDISAKMDPLLRGLWGNTLYRIVLTLRGGRTEGKVSYKVEK